MFVLAYFNNKQGKYHIEKFDILFNVGPVQPTLGAMLFKADSTLGSLERTRITTEYDDASEEEMTGRRRRRRRRR